LGRKVQDWTPPPGRGGIPYHAASKRMKHHETIEETRNHSYRLQKNALIIELLATSVVPVYVNANASRQM